MPRESSLQPHRPGTASRPSIRRTAAISLLVVGAIASLVAAALVWTSARLRGAIDVVNRDTRSVAITDEVVLTLLTYQRLSNIAVATGNPEVVQEREELAGELDSLLVAVDPFVASPDERMLLDSLSLRMDRYFEDRALQEARGTDLVSVATATQRSLEEVLEVVDSVRALNEAQVRAANEQAVRINRISLVIATASAALLLALLLLMFVAVHRYGIRPILALGDALERFRHGETEVRAEVRGADELAHLATRFNEMADALARAREERLAFMAGVVHDLRNPLGPLQLAVATLERQPTHAERARTLKLLEQQFERLSRMVDDLLDATHIEAGRLELQVEDVDLRSAAEDVVRLHALSSPAHDVRLSVEGEQVFVRGDALRIEQVIGNLLSNALKFTPDGGRIEVAVRAEADFVVTAVRDYGIGIEDSEVPELFVPFHRGRPEVASGVGLGLSVVQRIVYAHGGRIDVETQPGRGSTFTVHWPRSGPAQVDLGA